MITYQIQTGFHVKSDNGVCYYTTKNANSLSNLHVTKG